MLPEQKTGMPWCLYLDQNKWIDLSRAYYGRTGGERYGGALRATRDAVARGTPIAPCSLAHSLGTLVARDSGPRRPLAPASAQRPRPPPITAPQGSRPT